MKKTLTFNTVSLLEGNLFENNVAFARSYIIYSSNVNKSQTDSNVILIRDIGMGHAIL